MTFELPKPQMALTKEVWGHAKRFSKDEDGLITIFATFMVIMILMVCGIAVDLMRNEIERTRLQNTLDRAIVAAADLDSTLDAETVVYDYFEKAGVKDYLEKVVVTPGEFLPTSHFRTVEAYARSTTPSPYMAMTGVDTLPVFTDGKAEEVISKVEVSLIVDVSGSMNSNNRLTNLKIAAQAFVDQVTNKSPEDRLHISIIPYATQVSMPQHLVDQLNLSGEHDYSHCVNFPSGSFSDTAISTTAELEQTMHFDPWNNYDGRDDDPEENLVQRPVCEALASREMLLYQNDPEVLKEYIRNLTARGNTSIDIGMKWGVALVDPSMNQTVRSLIAADVVPHVFADRPRPYDDEDTLKVLVLMTDGKNTSQYYIEDDHRRGLSEVWWNPRDEVYSMFDAGDSSDVSDNRYYLRDADGALLRPDGTSTGLRDAYASAAGWTTPFDGAIPDHGDEVPYGCDVVLDDSTPEPNDYMKDCSPGSTGGGTIHLTYAELWAKTSIIANVERNYYPFWNDSTARTVWRYGVYDTVGNTSKNNRTKKICDAVKSEEVLVFTIGFEAPEDGQNVLKDCASSAAHYFDVDGLEIADAFTAIAHEITQLRLTQ